MSYNNHFPGEYPLNEPNQPGIELKKLLKEIYKSNNPSFLEDVDYDLKGEGNLSDLFFESCMYYIIRRLVTSAETIHKSNGENLLTTRNKLREYLKSYTRYEDYQIKEITKLLIRILEAARDDFQTGVKNEAKKELKRHNWNCFTCGKSMSSPLSPTADHFWPRSMGGLSIKENLRFLCNICNNELKGNYIEAADYHFETISVPVYNYEGYKKNRGKSFDIAIFAKANYSCAYCGKAAYIVGEISVGRINTNDGWHFQNLTAYCPGHNPDNK